MTSLKSTILEAVKTACPKMYQINLVFGIAERLGHKHSLAERKCRELCREGLIKAIRNEKGYNIGYVYLPTAKPPLKKPEPMQARLFKPSQIIY